MPVQNAGPTENAKLKKPCLGPCGMLYSAHENDMAWFGAFNNGGMYEIEWSGDSGLLGEIHPDHGGWRFDNRGGRHFFVVHLSLVGEVVRGRLSGGVRGDPHVAISADYRIKNVNGTTPFESDAAGKSAVRWIRSHAKEMGIDPNRIAAAGASAGGQVAAFTALVPGLDDPADDRSVSAKSNAMLLWYGVVDNGPDGYGSAEMKARYAEVSPKHNISDDPPPCIFFLGTKLPDCLLFPWRCGNIVGTVMNKTWQGLIGAPWGK